MTCREPRRVVVRGGSYIPIHHDDHLDIGHSPLCQFCVIQLWIVMVCCVSMQRESLVKWWLLLLSHSKSGSENPCVDGSIPSLGTMKKKRNRLPVFHREPVFAFMTIRPL